MEKGTQNHHSVITFSERQFSMTLITKQSYIHTHTGTHMHTKPKVKKNSMTSLKEEVILPYSTGNYTQYFVITYKEK